jgi:hypothetical protein
LISVAFKYNFTFQNNLSQSKNKIKIMKQTAATLVILLLFCSSIIFNSCSKSSSASTGTVNSNPTLLPMALNNSWNYKIKNYDTTTEAVLDSSYAPLSISGETSANGISYFQFQLNGVNAFQLGYINGSTISAIDSSFGVNYYTFFVSGTGDSTQSINSWPITVSKNGSTCQGTDNLYAHYADTTLFNLDGTEFENSQKNVIISHDCSGNKTAAHVYFIKDGVGIVRISDYYYNPAGKLKLYDAWVLESQSLH